MSPAVPDETTREGAGPRGRLGGYDLLGVVGRGPSPRPRHREALEAAPPDWVHRAEAEALLAAVGDR